MARSGYKAPRVVEPRGDPLAAQRHLQGDRLISRGARGDRATERRGGQEEGEERKGKERKGEKIQVVRCNYYEQSEKTRRKERKEGNNQKPELTIVGGIC